MAEKTRPGKPGWKYEDKINNREWTFGEIAALYGGNEYMTKLVCARMKGQDPAACRDALEEAGAIKKLDDGGYGFTYYDREEPAWDIAPVEAGALVDFWLPEPPKSYGKETKNGYTVLETFSQLDGRLDVLAAKPMKDGRTEYVVGHNYDVDTGSWGYGTYRSALSDAVTAWDENRGIFPEKTLMADAENEHRSIAVAVPEGYLVARAEVLFGAGTGAVSLELWDRDGEFVSRLSTVEKDDDGLYTVFEFGLGADTPYDHRSFTSKEFSELPVAWASDYLKESVGLPAHDLTLDAAIVEDAFRKPGELRQAPGKPASVAAEAATPASDGKVCSASAAARGVEAPAHEVKRQK